MSGLERVSRVGIGERERERLEQFVGAVRASPHNLLSPRALEEVWGRHVAESAALAGWLAEDCGPLADVGSGGGFPGMVIAILRPGLQVSLIESTSKKARFLERTARGLGLEHVRVHDGRAEELAGGELAGMFGTVTARAVAPLARLIPWTLPLLRPTGRLQAIKGERWAQDVEAARGELGAGSFHVVGCPQPHRAATDPGPRVVTIARPDAPGLAEDGS